MIRNRTKKLTIGLLIFCLSGCILSCNQVSEKKPGSEGARPVMEQEQDPLPEGVLLPEIAKYSIEEIKQLESKQITWGPGSILDGQGRPEACVTLQKQYGKYGAWFIGEEEDKIYLTFDEGYENGYTSQILDVLKEKKVSAVFFITMDYVKKEPELVQRMIDEGHILGNHTCSHPANGMPSLSVEAQKDDIMTLHNMVLNQFGYDMKLFRFPAGIYSDQSLSVVSSLGYRSVFWSFAYRDFEVNNQPDPTYALNLCLDELHPGAIYLIHAVSRTNAHILSDFIDGARARGYEFGTYPVN